VSEPRKLTDILGEALGGNTGDNTETPQPLGDVLGAALQLVTVEEQLPTPPGDVLGAALRTATEQPSAVLLTGPEQDPLGAALKAVPEIGTDKTDSAPTVSSIDKRLAKLKRKLGGKA
jgi:hypothetical protein